MDFKWPEYKYSAGPGEIEEEAKCEKSNLRYCHEGFYYSDSKCACVDISLNWPNGRSKSRRKPVRGPKAIFPTLFNTGVDSNRNPLPLGVNDPHWTITDSVILLEEPATTYITGTWLPNDDSSAWIGYLAPNGAVSSFKTTFDLSNYDPLSVTISLIVSIDNFLDDFLVNGTSLSPPGGLPTNQFNQFSEIIALTAPGNSNPYSTPTPFINGINTMEFVVRNGINPLPATSSGIRVVFIETDGSLLS